MNVQAALLSIACAAKWSKQHCPHPATCPSQHASSAVHSVEGRVLVCACCATTYIADVCGSNCLRHLRRSSRKRLGPSDLRDGLLRQQGFKVLPLPYYEWQKLPSDKNGNLTAEGLKKFEAWLLAAVDGKQLW